MKKKSVLKYTFLNEIRRIYLLNRFRRKWSNDNPNNETIPNNIFDKNTVTVGDYSYGELNIVSFDNKTKLRIGRFVSIAQNVTFLLDVEHYTNHISTYPFKSKILMESTPETFSKGDIIVEDDVWIGFGVTIMSGVRIGKGSVIAAGSVVVKDVAPYSVVGGAPAKFIKYRFEDTLRERLKQLNFKKFNSEYIRKNRNLLYLDVEENIEELLKILNQ